MRILMQHSDKSFVQRILNPSAFPTLDIGNGQYATHKMAWTEANGKYYVHPTVLWDGKSLKDYGKDAFKHVMKTGNYIEFNSPEEADWFSTKYKAAWEK
jgi:hypothetical protein